MEDIEVAEAILDALHSDPHKHRVSELAEKIDVSEDQIVDVMNNYGPDADGNIEHRPGQGGGWLPEDIAEMYRDKRGDDVQIGYRWPDEKLREIPFDPNNPDHWIEMGVTFPVSDPPAPIEMPQVTPPE